MGDKSPKSRDRDKAQKTAAKAQSKNNQQARQASYSSAVPADGKKKGK
jgi:hypothetical protein